MLCRYRIRSCCLANRSSSLRGVVSKNHSRLCRNAFNTYLDPTTNNAASSVANTTYVGNTSWRQPPREPQHALRLFSSPSSPVTPDMDVKQKVYEYVEQGKPNQAQAVLLEENNLDRIMDEEELYDLRVSLLDAWIQHQDKLLEQCFDSSPETSFQQQQYQLSEICHAAQCAHMLLEDLDPFLSPKTAFLPYTKSSLAFSGIQTMMRHPGNNQSTANNASVVTICEEMTRRCNSVLTAWAKAVRAGYDLQQIIIAKSAKNNKNHKNNADNQSRITRAIPQRAQFLLDRMEASYEEAINRHNNTTTTTTEQQEEDQVLSLETAAATTDTTKTTAKDPLEITTMTSSAIIRPTSESYNRVMESWAFSNEHLRGTMTQRLFDKLCGGAQKNNKKKKRVNNDNVDGKTYKNIIWAWALSREKRAAFTATGHLMKMLRKLETINNTEQENNIHDDTYLEPSLEDYHVVLQAWTLSEDKASPNKARSILRLMELAHEKGYTTVQPDLTCYRLLLQAAAQRPYLPDLGPMIDDVLQKMNDNFMVPDSDCFGFAIRTWKNSALHPDASSSHRETSIRRCWDLLSEMKVAHNQSSFTTVEASTGNFNDVIEALTVSSHPRRVDQAEHLLSELEESIHKDDGKAVPNAETYTNVVRVWKTSDASEKIARAKSILRRFQDNTYPILRRRNLDDKKKESMVDVFNAFVDLCSSYRSRDEKDGLFVIREALAAIDIMRSLDGLEPNAMTFARLLEACEKLLPAEKKRQQLVETIFRLCCDDGMVDDNVLRQLRSVATPDQYSSIVIAVSEEDAEGGTKLVPETWTVNALGGRVVSADGRRTKPLSIDGRLTVTKSMQEFQMRRLRDKRNRNLLRGGRLPRPPKHPELQQDYGSS